MTWAWADSALLVWGTCEHLCPRPTGMYIFAREGTVSRMWGTVLAATGFIACPCHLPLTLPLIVGVLGGTGIGSFIGAHTDLVYGIFTGYFIVGIGAGVFLLNRKRRSSEGAACELPSETGSRKNGRGRETRSKRRRARV